MSVLNDIYVLKNVITLCFVLEYVESNFFYRKSGMTVNTKHLKKKNV